MGNSRGISFKEAIIRTPTLVKDCFVNNVVKVFNTPSYGSTAKCDVEV